MTDYTALIAAYYDHDPQMEWERSERRRLEFALTLRALEDHLPPPPGRILDCGGGPGRQAIELARRGYTVTLFDLSEGCLVLARRKAAEAGVELAAYEHGSAVDLSRFADESFDAVLLLGPLYHLLALEERRKALQECKRVLKPGGPLFAAFITRQSCYRDLAVKHPAWIPMAGPFLEQIEKSGQLLPRGFEKYEFIAYFARPDEAEDLLWESGLELHTVLGLEGLLSMIEEPVDHSSDEVFEHWADLNYRLARDPSILGGAEHLLGIAFNPAWRKALREIGATLERSGIAYKVVGGTSAALHGVRIPVKDVDVEMSQEDAYRFQEFFPERTVQPVALREGESYRSHFGVFDFEGVKVEISGHLERRENGGWTPTWTCTCDLIDLDGVAISVSWLEEETLAYIRRGRLDRAGLCLAQCDREKMLRLLRGQQINGVI